MAKRSTEDAAAGIRDDRVSKRVKREKQADLMVHDGTTAKIDGDSHGQERDLDDTTEAGNGAAMSSKLAKAEKRARKRARAEKVTSNAAKGTAENVVNCRGDTHASPKTDRKALKRAERATRKAEKASLPRDSANEAGKGVVYTNGSTSAAVSATPEVAEVPYREHDELASLPQHEIDSFVAEQLLGVEDPLKQSYRPIVSFKYLPVGDEQTCSFRNLLQANAYSSRVLAISLCRQRCSRSGRDRLW